MKALGQRDTRKHSRAEKVKSTQCTVADLRVVDGGGSRPLSRLQARVGHHSPTAPPEQEQVVSRPPGATRRMAWVFRLLYCVVGKGGGGKGQMPWCV